MQGSSPRILTPYYVVALARQPASWPLEMISPSHSSPRLDATAWFSLVALFIGLCAASGDYSLGMHDCYDMLELEPGHPLEKRQVNCEGGTARGMDTCFLLCGFCATPSLRFGLSVETRQHFCAPPESTPPNITEVGAIVAEGLMNVSAAHGYQFRAENATEDMAHLLTYMNRADMQALFSQPVLMLDFLNEHLNFALKVQGTSFARNVSIEMWKEYVLPFGFLDEKRDLYWRWRPVFHKTFSTAPTLTAAKTITEAVHALAALIPKAQMQGVVAIAGANDGDREFISGSPVKWHSGSSPMDMSSQQIVEFGGSCTGTAILLGAALRSVGIPARVAGCSSESHAATFGNDHHWVEYWDGSDPGPFGDFWHTKEGVSAGNAGGPWDSPSGPMNGCMRGLVAGSSLYNLWASSWSSPVFLPTMWGEGNWAMNNRFKGGINRCGAYCSTWGCGVNQSSHFAQSECEPS